MPGDSRALGDVHAKIREFLESSKNPALLEPGESSIALTSANYELELTAGRLTLQVWDDSHSVARRVSGIRSEQAGRLELNVEKFGKQIGTVSLIDLARPRGQQASRHGARLEYRERFRHSLSRQFPGWTIRDLSSEPDLEHSLSPAYPRAFLVKGAAGIAAIGAPPAAMGSSGVLTYGLIWLDYLRRREPRIAVGQLALFLPCGTERPASLRLLHLDPARAEYSLFAYDEGYECRVDMRDFGNVETQVPPLRTSTGAALPPELLERVFAIEGAGMVPIDDGTVSIRIHGLEIARHSASGLEVGLEARRKVSPQDAGALLALAREVARLRTTPPPGGGELHTKNPELWLESQVRRNLERIDPTLVPDPVYGQVPAIVGLDRSVLDLLAVDRTGRLAVVELKGSEDPQLPLQALDYWVRVNWHRERNDFSTNGYFRGIALRDAPARMILIAPALQFHPTTGTVLSYFDPGIEVERIGLAMDWRREVRIAFRLQGARAAEWDQEEHTT